MKAKDLGPVGLGSYNAPRKRTIKRHIKKIYREIPMVKKIPIALKILEDNIQLSYRSLSNNNSYENPNIKLNIPTQTQQSR